MSLFVYSLFAKQQPAADAWKSFTDQVSEIFEPAKPAEAPKPTQDASSTSSESFYHLLFPDSLPCITVYAVDY